MSPKIYPAGDLILAWASLSLIAKKLKQQTASNITLASLHLEFEAASATAKAYSEIWHSIYSKRANQQTKNRVASTLKTLAQQTYDHFLAAIDLFNQFCDEMDALGPHVTTEWLEIRQRISLARDGLLLHHYELELTTEDRKALLDKYSDYAVRQLQLPLLCPDPR